LIEYKKEINYGKEIQHKNAESKNENTEDPNQRYTAKTRTQTPPIYPSIIADGMP